MQVESENKRVIDNDYGQWKITNEKLIFKLFTMNSFRLTIVGSKRCFTKSDAPRFQVELNNRIQPLAMGWNLFW